MTDCKTEGCNNPVRGEAFDICWECWRRERRRENARESGRKRYKANPEKFKEAARRWQKANPEKAREAARRWQKANPERVKEIWRRYYHNTVKPRRQAEKESDEHGAC